MGFTKSEANPNLYFILVGADPLILVMYIDDLILTGIEDIIAGCKATLATKFKMKDIVLMQYFLELEVLSLQETLCGCRPKVLGNLRIW
jgi:hypothetical protein